MKRPLYLDMVDRSAESDVSIFGRLAKYLENMLERRRTMLCCCGREEASVVVVVC